MDDIMKEELNKLITVTGYNLKDDEERSKEEMTILAKSVKEKFGMEAGTFKKLVKVHYNASLEEERAKLEEFEKLYRELVG